MKIFAETESGSSMTIGIPESPVRTILGSIGTAPRNWMFRFLGADPIEPRT